MDGATDSFDVEPLGAADGIFVDSNVTRFDMSSGRSTPGVLDGSKDSSGSIVLPRSEFNERKESS